MAFRIEESFRVDASPDRVWAYLVDPERVVSCLPGAELLEILDDSRVRGRIKVKVGPVTAGYQGTAEFAERDPEARRVRVEARGEEASGPGSASMTMESVIEDVEGGSEVRVTADVEVAGKIVQFGRGMIETVSRQLFRQFTECARSALEPVDEPAAATTDPAPDRRGVEPERQSPRADDEEAVNLLSLLLSTLGEKIRGLFRRESVPDDDRSS